MFLLSFFTTYSIFKGVFLKYSDIVDYSKLDPFKVAAIKKFTPYLGSIDRLNLRVVPETLGEPAIAIDFLEYDFLLAFNVEGLGTKSVIAEMMSEDKRGKGVKYFESVGKDAVAMSTNDLSAIGAEPIVYGDIVSTGSSNCFDEEGKASALLEGYRLSCEELQIPIPCGETPTLQDVLHPNRVDLAGAAVGIIKPKENLVVGKELKEGDIIFGIESSGVHSNGVSLVRKICEALPEGYFTELPSGKILGEEILVPTPLYSNLLTEFVRNTKINYMQPITGHGWEKIMRHKKSFTYEINFVPPVGELFEFLQKRINLSDKEAYYTWNMGVGYVLMAPRESKEEIFRICKKHKFKCWEIGVVKNGEKSVKINPLGIEFLK
jgi:phosphoribosylformylglycinamidine cyclo-ligase